MPDASTTVLYIDGQNFINRIRSILRRRGVQTPDLTQFDFWGFLNRVFKDEQVDLAVCYFAKLHADKETEEKSKELLEREEKLKVALEGQGFKYLIAGSVRRRGRGDELSFQEKGVDVSIAVDIVMDVVTRGVKTVLLASSDSDLQPAVKAAKEHGAKVWYVGFAGRPNRGLMLTADRYVLISNDDVAAFYPETHPNEPSTVSSRSIRTEKPPRPAKTDLQTNGPAPSEAERFNEPPWKHR